jgi:hypothetical protein
MRKLIGPILSVLLLAGIGFAIWQSASEQWNTQAIKGLVGSEKLPFFHDPRVVERLADIGLEVEVEKAGSRQIATSYDLSQYDFAFPAGVPAAEKIRRERKVNKSFDVFHTPMVIASWKPIAKLLEHNGIVERRDGSFYVVKMRQLLDLVIAEKRWTDLKESQLYPANKALVVTTTDVRKSNSAAMFLALASYMLNDAAIVENMQQADKLIDPLVSLFLRQGFVERSSAVPFQDYLVMGPGKAPLVMIYEAQYLYEMSKPDSPILDDMVLLYPEPTLFTKHVLIPMSEGGSLLGQALKEDEKLRALALEHGLRTEDTAGFKRFLEQNKIRVPAFLVNVIEPPSYEVLEGIIQRIEQKYQGDGGRG